MFPHEDPSCLFGNGITLCQYYSYRLVIRQNNFNHLLCFGKLTQQFIEDAYIKKEGNNLNFIKNNHSKLRVEQFNGLMDYVNYGNRQIKVCRQIILPSTFIGSPRAIAQN
jgi:hypothetical protein